MGFRETKRHRHELILLTAATLAVGAFTFQAPVALTLSRQGLAVVLIASADFYRDGLPVW